MFLLEVHLRCPLITPTVPFIVTKSLISLRSIKKILVEMEGNCLMFVCERKADPLLLKPHLP